MSGVGRGPCVSHPQPPIRQRSQLTDDDNIPRRQHPRRTACSTAHGPMAPRSRPSICLHFPFPGAPWSKNPQRLTRSEGEAGAGPDPSISHRLCHLADKNGWRGIPCPEMAPFDVRTTASDRYHGPQPAVVLRRAASRCVALPQYSPPQYDLSSVVISRLVVVKCDAGKRDDAPASETSVLPGPPSVGRHATLVLFSSSRTGPGPGRCAGLGICCLIEAHSRTTTLPPH